MEISNSFISIPIRTVPVFEEEYLGDSLGKINYNFFVLDTALSNLSSIFFYQQPDNWHHLLEDLRFYLPALSSFGDYIFTKENYIRFNTMYNAVRALSAYWGRMEIHILYPLNFQSNLAALDFKKITETDCSEIAALAQQYCNMMFNVNNYLNGSKVRVGFLIYNKKPIASNNIITSFFSQTPSSLPGDFYSQDTSIDPGLLYRVYFNEIKENKISPYSIPINELIAFSRKQLEDLGFNETECALITSFNLLSQWHQSLISLNNTPGSRVEVDNYYSYLEKRPKIQKDFKNHIIASNWFLLCKELILALGKKFITPQSEIFNFSHTNLANPQRLAFSQTTIDWIKGKVGPYFNFDNVFSLGLDSTLLKKQIFNQFLTHLLDWYTLVKKSDLPQNTLYNTENTLFYVPPSSQTSYPFIVKKHSYIIPSTRPERRAEITLGDFGHFKSDRYILSRSGVDYGENEFKNQPHIWNQNISTLDTTLQIVPSYIAGIIFIEFELKNKIWLRTRFIPFQIRTNDFI